MIAEPVASSLLGPAAAGRVGHRPSSAIVEERVKIDGGLQGVLATPEGDGPFGLAVFAHGDRQVDGGVSVEEYEATAALARVRVPVPAVGTT
ncbi:hypothetical protein [Actinosynnema sp. NPDC020468]|uniref:hypothetical protein n=1 Tax=Actinosynnema sp. NPDC020468 TaxID=3154488 RepID=UPI0033D794D9